MSYFIQWHKSSNSIPYFSLNIKVGFFDLVVSTCMPNGTFLCVCAWQQTLANQLQMLATVRVVFNVLFYLLLGWITRIVMGVSCICSVCVHTHVVVFSLFSVTYHKYAIYSLGGYYCLCLLCPYKSLLCKYCIYTSLFRDLSWRFPMNDHGRSTSVMYSALTYSMNSL